MSSSDSESSDFSIDSIFENLLAVDFEEESDVEASARQTTSGADLGPAAQAQPVLEVEDLPYQNKFFEALLQSSWKGGKHKISNFPMMTKMHLQQMLLGQVYRIWMA